MTVVTAAFEIIVVSYHSRSQIEGLLAGLPDDLPIAVVDNARGSDGLEQLVTSKFIPVQTPVGMRIPMYCTSSGRAWLSSLPDEQVLALLQASDRAPRTPATLTDVKAIMARIVECRRVGYATNAEELFLGDMGIGAPILNRKGEALGAVHLSPPTSRWTMEEARKKLAPMVIECARAISSAVAH